MASGKPSKARLIRSQVEEVVLHLRQIQSSVAVAAAALKHQNCELDQDIANVLYRGVADKLQDQSERLEAIVRSIATLDRKSKHA
jgi:exonuclease V gamma subunit